MKAVLVALNSQYVHTSLAARALFMAAEERRDLIGEWQVVLWEGTINDDWRSSAAALYELQADLYAFSVYIWNAECVQRIAARLRQVLPKAAILCGGPEVSYDPELWLIDNPWLDYVLAGEAEETWPQFLQRFKFGDVNSAPLLPGLASRSVRAVSQDEAQDSRPGFPRVADLASLAFPYSEAEMRAAPQRIYYYESTRGCPFNCQYCLSAAQRPVRFRPLPQVYDDLQRFINAGVKQVKLVDRTFNCDRQRALQIWRFLIAATSSSAVTTSFHFELTGELLDEAALQVLRAAPPGLFQFEIGVQSTHAPTLVAIQRPENLNLLATRVRQVQSLRRQHLHLDLIVGLPEEDWTAAAVSFDWVAKLKPEMLQVGFLKMLRGSGLRAGATLRGDIFSPSPPYEILQTESLSHAQLLRLQRIAALVERYYNSGRYSNLLRGLERLIGSPFALFAAMEEFWRSMGYSQAAKEAVHYQRLAVFAVHLGMSQVESNCRLACDFCLWHRDEELPEPLCAAVSRVPKFIKALRERLSTEELHGLFPALAGWSGKELWRRVRVEHFLLDPDSLLGGTPQPAAPSTLQLFAFWRDRYGVARAARRSLSAM